jgi:hypothetical protein
LVTGAKVAEGSATLKILEDFRALLNQDGEKPTLRPAWCGVPHHPTGDPPAAGFFKDADKAAYLRLMAHHLADAGVRVPAWNPGRVSGFPRSPVRDYFDGAAGVADGGPLHSAFFRFQPPPSAW